MSCKLKDGWCKGFKLGYIHCSENCKHYEIPTLKISNDYEQWKDWLDRWGITYEEKTWNPNIKELIIGGNYCQAAIVFDLENNFKCMTAYE